MNPHGPIWRCRSRTEEFILGLPASTEIAVAYMSNGRAVMAQKMTADHKLAADSLRLTNGIPGITGSPYFCLSDLAKHWPSQEKARRVVFMVTNGEDPYYRSRDMQVPYLAAAIRDSQKARLLVSTPFTSATLPVVDRPVSVP